MKNESHALHARMGTEAIVYNDCDRCAEHAAMLGLSLDAENFELAWFKMRRVEVHDIDEYQNKVEAQLCRSLNKVRILVERHGAVIAGGREL